MSKFTSIKSVVYDFFNLNRQYTLTDYERYKRIVINGLEDLNIFVLKQIKCKYLDVTSINTCQLPDDYIDKIKVGLNYNERVYCLTENNNIVLPRDEECGLEIRDIIASESNIVELFTPYNYGGRYYSDTYGVRGGMTHITYRIDKEYDRIVLEGSVPLGTKILLEYESSGITVGEDSIVPVILKPCLLSYIYWMDDYSNRSKQDQYGVQCRRVRNLSYSFTNDDFRDSQLQMANQTAKR